MTGHHISSDKFLWGIASTLLFFTFLTVAVTWFHIPGPWNIIVALGIAVVKATLVALFFMNLWWDSKFNLMLLLMGISFLGILVILTLIDTLTRAEIVPSF